MGGREYTHNMDPMKITDSFDAAGLTKFLKALSNSANEFDDFSKALKAAGKDFGRGSKAYK